MTAGGGSYLNEVIYLAGGDNIASENPDDYLNVNYEYIVKRSPEAVILLDELSSRDKKRMKNILSGIPAVINGRVYTIKESDRDIFLRPGPRITEAVKKMAQILYPQAEGL
jgi:iron complex transport system substrate-binding protein